MAVVGASRSLLETSVFQDAFSFAHKRQPGLVFRSSAFPRCALSSPSECKDPAALFILYSRQLEDLVGNYSAQCTNTYSIVQAAKKS